MKTKEYNLGIHLGEIFKLGFTDFDSYLRHRLKSKTGKRIIMAELQVTIETVNKWIINRKWYDYYPQPRGTPKLKDFEVKSIRESRGSAAELANKFKCSTGTIYAVWNYKSPYQKREED